MPKIFAKLVFPESMLTKGEASPYRESEGALSVDYAQLTERFRNTNEGLKDSTGDGMINFEDLVIVQGYYQQMPGSSDSRKVVAVNHLIYDSFVEY